MAYEKQNWKDLPSKDTPVNAERLNHIEEGIYENSVGKQDTLVSGENIKTINNQSLLGSGNITIEGGGGGTVEEVIHDNTLIGKGTSESPLRVDQSKFTKPSDLTTKQDTLVSGTNIKTINNQSLLGSGNITIQGGGGEISPIVSGSILEFPQGSSVRVEDEEVIF